MGIVSSHDTLSPISLASTIIGFISFTFTLATFFRVFWTNLNTYFRADAECSAILSTLRIELEEERASLRALQRHTRTRDPRSQDVFHGPELRAADIAQLRGAVRRLTRRFEALERPFLADGAELERRKARRRRAERERRRGGGGEEEKGEDTPYDDEQEAAEDLYSTGTFGQRWAWLHSRSTAVALLESVGRLQTRRIARQVGEIACLLHGYKGTLEEMRHGVAMAEDKLSRVVGVRRVD